MGRQPIKKEFFINYMEHLENHIQETKYSSIYTLNIIKRVITINYNEQNAKLQKYE